MSPEQQNIEYKSSWHDDYLQCICGFANAQGGRLDIGRDDKGKVIGLSGTKKLLEELPGKIRNTMGIVVAVDLCRENGLDFISVTVPPHHNLISLKGKYYMRSGSTTLELTGIALDEINLRKHGRTWDSEPVPDAEISDFYNDAFDIFRKKAVTSERLSPEDVAVSNEHLLKILKMMHGSTLSRAAALAFHQDPEKWCIGSYVKIAYFENEADIRYQDEIGGPLIAIVDRVIDTIYTKYFKGLIHYEGIQRIDKYPMPRSVLREAVLNAVVHKDYSKNNPVQIRIYNDKVTIYNNCCIPPNMRPEELIEEHGSNPHNPLMAGAFFRSGQIEAWGRGIEKIRRGCLADNLPEPEFKITPISFSVTFSIRNNDLLMESGRVIFDQPVHKTVSIDTNGYKIKVIELLKERPMSVPELMRSISFPLSVTTFKRNVILPLKETGHIMQVISDRPQSKNQKYFIAHSDNK